MLVGVVYYAVHGHVVAAGVRVELLDELTVVHAEHHCDRGRFQPALGRRAQERAQVLYECTQLSKGLGLAFLIPGRDRPGVADQCVDVIAPHARESPPALRTEQNAERARQLRGIGVDLRGVSSELWTASKGGSHRVDGELEVFSEQLAERRPEPRERAIEAGRKVSGATADHPCGDERAERELALIILPLDPVGGRVVAGGVGIGEVYEVVDVRPQTGFDHWRGGPA